MKRWFLGLHRVEQIGLSVGLIFTGVVVFMLADHHAGGSPLGTEKKYVVPIDRTDVCPGSPCSVEQWQEFHGLWEAHGASERLAVSVPSCLGPGPSYTPPGPGVAQVRPWPQRVPVETGLTQAEWDSKVGWTVTYPGGAAIHWLRACEFEVGVHEVGHLDWPDVNSACSPMNPDDIQLCWQEIEHAYRRSR